VRINDNQARIAGVARYKARLERPAPAPLAAAHPGPQRLPPALECVGLRTAVAFGRTVPPWKEAGERGSCKTPARGLNDAEDAPGSGSVLADGPAGNRGDGSERLLWKSEFFGYRRN